MTDPVTVVPDSLTLAPGESGQVTVTVDPDSESGVYAVEVEVKVPSLYDHIWEGDSAIVVPAGERHLLRGQVDFTASAHVRGLLELDPYVQVDGHGFDIHTHDGTLNFVGVEKTAWCRWGDEPVGWNFGDRLAVAPTAKGVYVSSETTWQGSWEATARPANSPDVTLVDGSIARPEVVNLSQTVTLRNLQRIMVHEASALNPQTFKWIRVLDSGELNVLGHYPIHFHMIGDNARGSIHEGVVVEGGRNHAYVPHASHGITYTGCVAYNTIGPAYWWDLPPDQDDTVNDSDDIVWDDCLALGVKSSPGGVGSSRTAGFWLGAGQRLSCNRSVVVGVQGTTAVSSQRSGFHWPEGTSRTSWAFRDCVGHNNINAGLLVWQNARSIDNHIEDFIGYHNQRADIEHGSYVNRYQYRGAVLSEAGFMLHAKSAPEGPCNIEDILSAGPLVVTKHNSALKHPTFFRRCSFPKVVYDEPSNGSNIHYEDCGLTPADFTLTRIAAESIIEIYEGGDLTHRWAVGVWR